MLAILIQLKFYSCRNKTVDARCANFIEVGDWRQGINNLEDSFWGENQLEGCFFQKFAEFKLNFDICSWFSPKSKPPHSPCLKRAIKNFFLHINRTFWTFFHLQPLFSFFKHGIYANINFMWKLESNKQLLKTLKRFKIYRRISTDNNNELLVHEHWMNLFHFEFFAIDVYVMLSFIDQQNKKMKKTV